MICSLVLHISPSWFWIRACKRFVAAADERRVKALEFLFAIAEAGAYLCL